MLLVTSMRTYNKKILVIEPGGGLCNRLICINNAIHVAEKENMKLQIAWWKEPECGCRYADILKPIKGVAVKEYERPITPRSELLKKRKVISLIKSTVENLFFQFYYRDNNPDRISGYWSNDNVETESKMRNAIHALKDRKRIYARMDVQYRTENVISQNDFSNEVKSSVEMIKKEFEKEPYIGLHIRRTDHQYAIENSPISFFKNAIAKEIEKNSTVRFYVATDDEDVLQSLIKQYGYRIVYNKNCKRGRASAQAIQDAAADLLMLAGAEKIYGSAKSTFSEFAAELGKIELIV